MIVILSYFTHTLLVQWSFLLLLLFFLFVFCFLLLFFAPGTKSLGYVPIKPTFFDQSPSTSEVCGIELG